MNPRGTGSPDGTKIAFNSDRSGPDAPATKDRFGSSPELRGGGFQVSWSTGGNWLTFVSGRAGTLDIWRVAASGGERERLTCGEGSSINPFVSVERDALFADSGPHGGDLWNVEL